MLKSFFSSRKWALWAYGGLLVLLGSVSAQVQIQVYLNEWYGEFFNLLQASAESDIADFWKSIVQFYQLAFTYVTIAVFSSFFASHWVFRWRQAMTFTYIPLWSSMDKEIEGSSQRIQEDTQRFARIVESLGLELFESFLKVLAFVAILWALSEQVALPLLADYPGSLVWLVLLIALGGTLISLVVGIKLPGLEYNNQKVEAAFRKQLVYGEDQKHYADVPTLFELFLPLRRNYFQLFLHYGYFNIWRIFFVQSVVLIPYIAMAPGMFAGVVTLGVVQQTAHAFNNVLDSFSYLIRSWTTVTELLSIVKRLREFEIAIGYRTDKHQTAEPVQNIT